MKILIIVLSYNDDGGIYSKFYKSQKETWDSVNVDGVHTYYLFGNHNKNEIIDDKILTEVIDDSFFCCGHKTIKSFELTKNLDYDYVFRTNSSSYIDKQLLFEYILDKPLNDYYSGVIGNHAHIKFASGSGYFLSRNLVNKVLQNHTLWNHELIDDVAIADLLSQYNIYPSENPRYDLLQNDNNIPYNFFHYRLKTSDRNVDIQNMYNIFALKKMRLWIK